MTKGKGQMSFSKRWKANGSWSKGDSCSFYIRVPQETERHRRKKWRTQEYLTSNQAWITSEGGKVKSKYPLLCRREKDRLMWKAQQVGRPVLRLELKSLVYGERNAKNRRVIIGIITCVVITSLETDALMAIVACIDMLMVRRSPARGREEEGTQEAVAILKGK